MVDDDENIPQNNDIGWGRDITLKLNFPPGIGSDWTITTEYILSSIEDNYQEHRHYIVKAFLSDH